MMSITIFVLLVCLASAFEFRQSSYLMSAEVIQPRIINGQIAPAANKFPYQVGVSVSNGNGTEVFFCGGSLLSNKWVLTAAHCTVFAQNVIVYLGSNKRLDRAVSYTVDKSNITVHADFNLETANNDIALIKIPAVKFTKAIQPVKLPKPASSYPSYEGKTVTATGWGLTSDSSTSPSPVLQFANFKVISNKVCAVEYGTAVINSGKLCTATPNRTSICGGDSGGPLVLAGSRIQIGIASIYSGQGCEKGVPNAFTRVTSYLGWIKENTKN